MQVATGLCPDLSTRGLMRLHVRQILELICKYRADRTFMVAALLTTAANCKWLRSANGIRPLCFCVRVWPQLAVHMRDIPRTDHFRLPPCNVNKVVWVGNRHLLGPSFNPHKFCKDANLQAVLLLPATCQLLKSSPLATQAWHIHLDKQKAVHHRKGSHWWNSADPGSKGTQYHAFLCSCIVWHGDAARTPKCVRQHSQADARTSWIIFLRQRTRHPYSSLAHSWAHTVADLWQCLP